MTTQVSIPDWKLSQSMPDLMISKLSHLGLLSLEGEQAQSFLQGQVTADVISLEQGQWCWGAHCDPKGKMLASFRLFEANEQLMMLMPISAVAIDLAQLQKYAVFSKVELSDASDNWAMYGVAGAGASSFIESNLGKLESNVHVFEQGIVIKDADRFIVIIRSECESDWLADQTIFDATAWQQIEVRSGYPNIAAHHSGEFVPQMCNLDAIGGISFTKGCYMGQETVARMKYRGGNKRALYVLSGSTAEQVAADSSIEIALESGFRRAGKVVEWVQRENEVLLTAVLANDTPMDAKLRIAGDVNSMLEVQPLPYSLDVE
ncbi:MAG: tRNA-modifying protein YgfZ [Parashewanella sp.]